MKINHLLPQGQEKIIAEVFIPFGIVVPVKICSFSNKSDFQAALRFRVTCIDQRNLRFCATEL